MTASYIDYLNSLGDKAQIELILDQKRRLSLTFMYKQYVAWLKQQKDADLSAVALLTQLQVINAFYLSLFKIISDRLFDGHVDLQRNQENGNHSAVDPLPDMKLDDPIGLTLSKLPKPSIHPEKARIIQELVSKGIPNTIHKRIYNDVLNAVEWYNGRAILLTQFTLAAVSLALVFSMFFVGAAPVLNVLLHTTEAVALGALALFAIPHKKFTEKVTGVDHQVAGIRIDNSKRLFEVKQKAIHQSLSHIQQVSTEKLPELEAAVLAVNQYEGDDETKGLVNEIAQEQVIAPLLTAYKGMYSNYETYKSVKERSNYLSKHAPSLTA